MKKIRNAIRKNVNFIIKEIHKIPTGHLSSYLEIHKIPTGHLSSYLFKKYILKKTLNFFQ